MKPILFNTEMVRAIQNGTKTATRRVVKPQPPDNDPHNVCFNYIENGTANFGMRNRTPLLVKLPYRSGDILYVWETWERSMAGTYLYKATDTPLIHDGWRPSIHMPREAARIFLRVTDVRVERLRPISDTACMAEGITCAWNVDLQDVFSEAWDSTIKPADRVLYGWAANPWVWVIEFERISKEKAYEE